MDDNKRIEILGHFEDLITKDCDLNQLAKDIELSYIFGDQVPKKAKYNFGISEHYIIDELVELANLKYNELFPVME